MLLWERNFMFRRTLFRYLWITLMSRDKLKLALMYFMRQQSMIIGILMETSPCLNPESVWQDSSCSTKIHQKDTCGFKTDWRRNRLLQDLDTFGQKNGHQCRKTFSAKPWINGQKKKQKWTQREHNEALTLFQTNDRVCEDIVEQCKTHSGHQESLSDALQSHQTSQPERFKLVATLCKWLVQNWNEKIEVFKFTEPSWEQQNHWTAKNWNHKE